MFGLFKSTRAAAPAPIEVRLGGRTDWREIVHMRDHSREILAILKEQGRPSDRDPDEIAASGPVALVRETGPSGDAVAVVFAGRRVGYLSKRDAAKVAPGLAQLIPAGHVAVTGARIARHLNHHPERLRAGSQFVLEVAVPEFSGVVTVAPPDEWFPQSH